MKMDTCQLHDGNRPTRIIKCVSQFIVPTVKTFEYSQIALMAALIAL